MDPMYMSGEAGGGAAPASGGRPVGVSHSRLPSLVHTRRADYSDGNRKVRDRPRSPREQALYVLARVPSCAAPCRRATCSTTAWQGHSCSECDETSIAMDEQLERLSRSCQLLPNHVCSRSTRAFPAQSPMCRPGRRRARQHAAACETRHGWCRSGGARRRRARRASTRASELDCATASTDSMCTRRRTHSATPWAEHFNPHGHAHGSLQSWSAIRATLETSRASAPADRSPTCTCAVCPRTRSPGAGSCSTDVATTSGWRCTRIGLRAHATSGPRVACGTLAPRRNGKIMRRATSWTDSPVLGTRQQRRGRAYVGRGTRAREGDHRSVRAEVTRATDDNGGGTARSTRSTCRACRTTAD